MTEFLQMVIDKYPECIEISSDFIGFNCCRAHSLECGHCPQYTVDLVGCRAFNSTEISILQSQYPELLI